MSPRTPSFSSLNSLCSCWTHPIPRTALVSPRSPSLRFKKTRIYFKQKTQKKIYLGFFRLHENSLIVVSSCFQCYLVKCFGESLQFKVCQFSKVLWVFNNSQFQAVDAFFKQPAQFGCLILKKKTNLPGLSFLVFSKNKDWLGPGIW